MFRQEHSFRLQIVASVVVLFFAWYYPISSFELIIVFLLIGFILALEMMNSVFERIVDAFKPRIHPIVREVKDIMAGTVLILSITAFCIGILIFGHHLLWSFSRLSLY